MIKLEKNASSVCVEQLADKIGRMDRADLVRTLRGLECNFKLDFSDDFLESVSIERQIGRAHV